MNSIKTALVIDNQNQSTQEIEGSVYLWSGYSQKNNSKSLLRMIDKNSDFIRKRYLDIHSEIVLKISKKIKYLFGKSELINNLFRSSLTLENSYFKSPQILDALRLIVLEKELNKINYKNLYYYGDSRIIARSIKILCKKNKTNFYWKKKYLKKKIPQLNLSNYIPHFIKATVFLIVYAIKSWKLRAMERPIWNKGLNSIFFFSYFVHLSKDFLKKGEFHSKLWESLPSELSNLKYDLNWMHMFEKTSLVPTNNLAVDYLNRFNEDRKSQGSHGLLNSYFGLDIFFSAWFSYCKVYFKTFFLFRKINKLFNENLYWPVLKNDWVNSITNTAGMQSVIWHFLFKKSMSLIPHQPLGLYLCENQGWERIFSYFWKKNGHGKLIGVAHSTISFWDLRYFDKLCHSIVKPKPDIIAINGPVNWKILKSAEQKMSNYEKVEALRYLYLNKLTNNLEKDKMPNIPKILILGDIIPQTTNEMLACIMPNAIINDSYKVTFKPHPANPVNLKKYPELQSLLTDKSLYELLINVNIVITTVFTSASLDAYCSQGRVSSYLDPNSVKYSFFRGIDGANFFTSPDELINIFKKINNKLKVAQPAKSFFWLDNNLPKWKKLISDTAYL